MDQEQIKNGKFLGHDMSYIYEEVKKYFYTEYGDLDLFLRNHKDCKKIGSDFAEFKTAYLVNNFLVECREHQKNYNNCRVAFEHDLGPFHCSYLRSLKPIKILKKAGDNHPDIIFTYNDKIINIEVKLVTTDDSRMSKQFNLGDKESITDKEIPNPKYRQFNSDNHDAILPSFTAPIKKACDQYKKWRLKGTVSSGDTKIVVLMVPEIFPSFYSLPILEAAYSFCIQKYYVEINEKNLRSLILQFEHRDYYKKHNGTRIYESEIYEAISSAKIDGVIALFPSITCLEVQIININNNEFVDDFRMYLESTSGLKVSCANHVILS